MDSTTPALRLHAPDPDAAPSAGAPVPGRRVPADAIDAYWDDVEGRVGYLLALLEVERYGETLTLCATYLESIVHALVTTNPHAATGGEAPADEDDPFLGLIHPQQLARLVTQLPGISAATTAGFPVLLDTAEPRLLYKDQAIDLIRSTLPLSESVLVERALWKCTVAYITYDFLRTQSYRRREGVRTIGLGMAFYEGESHCGLSVPELVALMRSLIAEARARSHATGRLPEPA